MVPLVGVGFSRIGNDAEAVRFKEAEDCFGLGFVLVCPKSFVLLAKDRLNLGVRTLGGLHDNTSFPPRQEARSIDIDALNIRIGIGEI